MVIAHAAMAFWHNFHPWITKNMDLETIFHFATRNNRKSSNCAQSGSQEDPKMHSKIDENTYLGSGFLGCPVGPLDHQNDVPGTQKGTSRSPK